MHVCVLLPRYRDGGSQGDIPRLPHTPHPRPQRPSWNRSTAGCALALKLMGRLLSAALGPRSSGERNFLRHFTSALLAGSRLRSWYDSHGYGRKLALLSPNIVPTSIIYGINFSFWAKINLRGVSDSKYSQIIVLGCKFLKTHSDI